MTNLFAIPRHDTSGTAAIEFALILPVFLAFVFSIIELGYVLWGYSALEYGASYGARYAFVHNTSSASAIESAALAGGATSSNFTYTVSGTSPVTITGTFTYTPFYTYLTSLSSITITTSVTQTLPTY